MRLKQAFTRSELIVAITVAAVLATVIVPLISNFMLKQRLTGSIGGSRQLYIASFSMATDFAEDERPGWPGDLSRRQKDPITTTTAYFELLMEQQYLNKVDMAGLLKKAGGNAWNTAEPLDAARHSPFKIYRVKASDDSSVLFCATRNFTYNAPLNPKVRPHGDKGFVVFRKGGDGSVFAKNTSELGMEAVSIGLLPGRKVFESGVVETTADYLTLK